MSSAISLNQIVFQGNATITNFLKPEVSWLRCSSIPRNIYKFIYKTKFTVDSNNSGTFTIADKIDQIINIITI